MQHLGDDGLKGIFGPRHVSAQRIHLFVQRFNVPAVCQLVQLMPVILLHDDVWQAVPCASSTTTSETALSPWIPDQVASGALLGSSPVCFESASNRLGFTGVVLCWLGPVLPVHVLSHFPRFCVWLSLPQFVWSREPLLCFFHLNLDLSTDVISLNPCVSKKIQSGV